MASPSTHHHHYAPSKESFTDDEEDVSLLYNNNGRSSNRAGDKAHPTTGLRYLWKHHPRLVYVSLLVHFVLISAYTSIFLYMLYTIRIPTSWTVPSPATEAIEYQRETFYPVTYDNDFTGEPRPEFDAAWHELLKYSHIRVSKEELEASNYTSLVFKDGTGYIAQLASTHQLHCLKQIRHYLHRDHYTPNATADEVKAQGLHIDHCLEVLRLSTMCSGDTSLTPFYFAETDDGLLYPFVKTRTYHHCVKWDRLRDWTSQRSVDLFDPDLLRLPEGKTLLENPVPSMVLS